MPKKRKQIAEAFRAAKRSLERKGYGYICVELDRVRAPGAAAAKRIIAERMEAVDNIDYFSLETWLLINDNAKTKHITPDNMLAYRLRWLDALIKEFES